MTSQPQTASAAVTLGDNLTGGSDSRSVVDGIAHHATPLEVLGEPDRSPAAGATHPNSEPGRP